MQRKYSTSPSSASCDGMSSTSAVPSTCTHGAVPLVGVHEHGGGRVAAQVHRLRAVGVGRDDDPAVGVDAAGHGRHLRPTVAAGGDQRQVGAGRGRSRAAARGRPARSSRSRPCRQPRRRGDAQPDAGPYAAPRRLDTGPSGPPIPTRKRALLRHVWHLPQRPAQRRDRRARRPRQDHAGRRDAPPGRRVHRAPGRGRGRPGDGLRRPGAREGDHDPREEHRDPLRRPRRPTASR